MVVHKVMAQHAFFTLQPHLLATASRVLHAAASPLFACVPSMKQYMQVTRHKRSGSHPLLLITRQWQLLKCSCQATHLDLASLLLCSSITCRPDPGWSHWGPAARVGPQRQPPLSRTRQHASRAQAEAAGCCGRVPHHCQPRECKPGDRKRAVCISHVLHLEH